MSLPQTDVSGCEALRWRLIAKSPVVLTNAFFFHIIGNVESKQAIDTLAALAQKSRLAIFRLLVKSGPEGLCAGDIAERLRLPPATLSFHLKALDHAGLVTSRSEGRFVYYAADFSRMSQLLSFLTADCCGGHPDLCLPKAVAVAPPRQRAARR